MTTTNASVPHSTKPRLWVETLWLLESLTASEPLREISLRPGLNLIVSPPEEGSSGHGVGKSAFCQLLRFALDDPLWAEGTTLRDELLRDQDLKDGAVAARVHIGGEVWTVLKPWRHQKMYRASRVANWRQLAAGSVENDYEIYKASLQRNFVDILPVQKLPGSGQHIEWHHILAWCSRDQNARYQHYFQWRSEGVRFSLPAKSPLALIQIALGLLGDATTLQELDKVIKDIDTQSTKLDELREDSALLLRHVRRQLANRLEGVENTPFRQEGLIEHPNLIGLARQSREAYQQELISTEAERKKLADEHQVWLEEHLPLKNDIDLLANEIGQIEALIAGDMKRVEALQHEATSLQKKLSKRCDAGNRQLGDCQYVIERIEQTQIDRKLRITQNQRTKEVLEGRLSRYLHRLQELRIAIEPVDRELIAISRKNSELDKKYGQSLASSKLLLEAIEDYEHYEGLASGRSQSAEMEALQRKLNSAQIRHGKLQLQLEKEQQASSGRRKVISETMDAIANSLPSFQWGVFNDEEKYRNHPFRIGPMHSTTYRVLEILAGDIACLIDSVEEHSFHPGFLLHDSPREAEMNESILWMLLEHVRKKGGDEIQYIVTTSTEPEEGLQKYVRFRLLSDNEDDLLLRKRFGGGQAQLA